MFIFRKSVCSSGPFNIFPFLILFLNTLISYSSDGNLKYLDNVFCISWSKLNVNRKIELLTFFVRK